MAASAQALTSFEWPAEVLAFAAQRELQEYLQPMLDATRHIFPTALSIQVTLDPDPEIRDLAFIVFNVDVPRLSPTEYLAAQHQWNEQLVRLRPYPVIDGFILLPRSVNR